MVSDSSTKMKLYEGHERNEAMGPLLSKISQLKKQIQGARVASIKGKLRRNGKKLDFSISELRELSNSRTHLHSLDWNGSKNMLSYRLEKPLFKLRGFAHGEKDSINDVELLPIEAMKLPFVDKIASYTTWIFLDKNQRMLEDQSVVGRRQIYYDQNGGETLISSDSDDEYPEPGEVKRAFSEGEDQMLWKFSQEHVLTEDVLDALSQSIGATSAEIQDRYNILREKYQKKDAEPVDGSGDDPPEKGISLDKSLDAALDSFDNLFCRRCLVFDCRLHGCSQSLVTPLEKQPSGGELGENGKPCSDQCYLWSRKQAKDMSQSGTAPTEKWKDKNAAGNSSETAIVPKSYAGAVDEFTPPAPSDECSGKRKKGKVVGAFSGGFWSPIEKDLYLKGIEIFGKNSCLVSRNLLSGLKTCTEVYTYMFKDSDSMPQSFGAFLKSGLEDDGTAEFNFKAQEIPSRSRLFRRRGKTRKLKYTWKSAGHPSIRKRIADGKNQLLKQYTPCGCETTCGKQCPCVDSGNCCEKFCGCPKSCKRRFRGCHCAKSQCRSRQCPCFAANRECDPDVCRNCWVGCGDGSLGEQPAKLDGYQCENMKLLLKQHQRILLSKSSVAGWGAFIKNAVNKNDYLGEYTGEIISQKEADKRGKIYDRANSSFLFDLNDQCVLDAYRKGDKLKFANHSSTPNCYAKIMLVAGDHRVGIFAKERIEAGEELFYDYFYSPDQAPVWARKPEGSKKDDSSMPHARARKHQSH